MSIFDFRKALLFFMVCFFTFCARGQQSRFIYLQTDNAKPFYVKLNNKTISSSAEGYVILPKITDGKYRLIVGFPRNEFPEEKFDINIDKNNEGFLLKNFSGKGWELFNLQSLALIGPVKKDEIVSSDTVASIPKKDTEVVNKKDDAFTNMLANVVKDSSILQDHAPVAEIPKPQDSSVAIQNAAVQNMPVQNDTASVARDSALVLVERKDTAVAVPAISPGWQPTEVTKILSIKDADGAQMVYRDKNGSSVDTVRVFFPAKPGDTAEADTPKMVINDQPADTGAVVVKDTARFTITPTEINQAKQDSSQVKEDVNLNAQQVLQDTAATVADTSSHKKEFTVLSDGTQLFKINTGDKENKEEPLKNNSNRKEEKDTRKNKKSNNENEPAGIILLPKAITSSQVNPYCKDFATDKDFLKLHRKMAAESKMENMLKVAGRYFKLKCYSTDQIRNLSYLFLTEEGKYMFLDEAYSHASDSDQFDTLEIIFKDEYYLNRFKAMLRQ